MEEGRMFFWTIDKAMKPHDILTWCTLMFEQGIPVRFDNDCRAYFHSLHDCKRGVACAMLGLPKFV